MHSEGETQRLKLSLPSSDNRAAAAAAVFTSQSAVAVWVEEEKTNQASPSGGNKTHEIYVRSIHSILLGGLQL